MHDLVLGTELQRCYFWHQGISSGKAQQWGQGTSKTISLKLTACLELRASPAASGKEGSKEFWVWRVWSQCDIVLLREKIIWTNEILVSNEMERLGSTRERIFQDLRCKSGKIFFLIKVETDVWKQVQIQTLTDDNNSGQVRLSKWQCKQVMGVSMEN